VAPESPLDALIRMTGAPTNTKHALCIEATCGDKGDGACLSSRAKRCVKGTCNNCGMRRLWSGPGGLREYLVELDESGFEKLRADVEPEWYEEQTWSRYAYRDKPGAGGARAGADEDEAYEAKKKSKELYVEKCRGSLVEFLDEFEAVLSAHVWHRSVLDRERVAVLEHHRGRVPSELTLDMDFAENLELGEARPVRTIAWSSPLLELMSLLFVLRSKVSTGSPISPR